MDNRKLVSNEEWLYRRSYTSPEKKYMNPDGTATSRAFKLRNNDNDELSVDVASMTSPEKAINDNSKFMLFKILNQSVVDLELKTLYDPIEDGSNNAHAVIVGMQMEDDIKPGLLARKSLRVYV